MDTNDMSFIQRTPEEIKKYGKEYVDHNFCGKIFNITIEQIAESPLSENTKSNPFSIFNRHGILHGIILNYDNRINSYKTISLLWLLSSTQKFLLENRNAT